MEISNLISNVFVYTYFICVIISGLYFIRSYFYGKDEEQRLSLFLEIFAILCPIINLLYTVCIIREVLCYIEIKLSGRKLRAYMNRTAKL